MKNGEVDEGRFHEHNNILPVNVRTNIFKGLDTLYNKGEDKIIPKSLIMCKNS